MSKKRRRSSAKSKTTLVPYERKQEILGLILAALAFLIGLALVTYDPVDNALARAFSWRLALAPPGRSPAENALGLVGAFLAYGLVPKFLGYTTLLLVGLLFAWGYVLLRRRKPVYLPLLSGLTLVGTFFLACLFGWFALTLETDLSVWSGALGRGMAGFMQRIFGTVGALILLLLILAVVLLLVVDRDIQRSIDRLEEGILRLREVMSAWWSDSKERRAERVAEIARRREERRRTREAERRAREQQRPAQPARPAEPTRPAERPAAPRPAAEPAEATPADRFGTSLSPAPARPPVPEPPPDLFQPALKIRERIEEERAEVIERLADVPHEEMPYAAPSVDLLDAPDEAAAQPDLAELEENKQILLDKLATYKIDIVDINAVVGPTITLYELAPAPGVKISRITSLEDDLAMAMAARGIRMIAPIPGKSAIGVEIPNRHRELVRLRDVIATAKFRDAKMELPIPIGKSIEGEVFLEDLTRMPHLLVAGATGAGKSVGINVLIAGLLYACHPANLKFVLIDPKKIELQQYSRLLDHFVALPEDGEDAIITDFTQALGVLKSCEREMERRYDLLAKAGVRGIKDYNKKVHAGALPPGEGHRHLPYIVVVVDELADLMMTAGKEIEGPIARLAQMARAVGIHLVLATQRPSVDVITGLIKANFPSRIAYQVASKIDSRVILDQPGAEGLVGNGDLLYMNGSRVVRLQGPFVSVDEVDRLTEAIARQPGPGPYLLPAATAERDDEPATLGGDPDELDDLFEEAARIIVRSQQGSVSLLQRKLSVGYTRAARIVDQLEEAGIVGPFEGSKARQVLVPDEMHLDQLLQSTRE